MTTKVERQITLLNVLLNTTRPLGAEEIRRRVPGYPERDDSFRRTFERDKADLRAMGQELVVEIVPGSDPPLEGYRIDRRSHSLPDPGLEPDELEALALASRLIGGRAMTGVFLKLGVGMPSGRPTVEVPTDPELVRLFTAIAERRRLRFVFNGIERRVEPHRLELRRGHWYLTGHDLVRGEIRSYRRDRLPTEIVIEEEADSFDPPTDGFREVEVEPWAFDEPTETVEVTVHFDAEVASAVRHDLRTATILRDDDAGLLVRVPVTNRPGFHSWILEYLDRAEIIEPESVRRELVQHLEGLVDA